MSSSAESARRPTSFHGTTTRPRSLALIARRVPRLVDQERGQSSSDAYLRRMYTIDFRSSVFLRIKTKVRLHNSNSYVPVTQDQKFGVERVAYDVTSLYKLAKCSRVTMRFVSLVQRQITCLHTPPVLTNVPCVRVTLAADRS